MESNNPQENRGNQDTSSEEEAQPENLSFKIIVIGNCTVGKTQVICRYTQDHFNKQYKKSIGCDFYQKRLELSEDINVNLQIWDIDGDAISGKMLDTYIHDTNAIVFVYDITQE